MEPLDVGRCFTLLEPGPVVWVVTHDGQRASLMTITWTMAMDFAGTCAITTGAWNHSWQALRRTRDCVIAIPPAEMIDTVVDVGMCSGRDVDKFDRFGLTPLPASRVAPPLVAECLANIECRVVEIVEPYNIVVLQAVAGWEAPDRAARKTLHAVGDGTFVTDGDRLDRRARMRAKLPPGF